MKETIKFNWKIEYFEEGFCRIVYKTQGGYYLCFQDEGDNFGGVVLYGCNNPDHEPEAKVIPRTKTLVELPEKDRSELANKVREFISNHDFFEGYEKVSA